MMKYRIVWYKQNGQPMLTGMTAGIYRTAGDAKQALVSGIVQSNVGDLVEIVPVDDSILQWVPPSKNNPSWHPPSYTLKKTPTPAPASLPYLNKGYLHQWGWHG